MIAKLLRTFLNAIQPGDGPEDVNAKDVESWQRIAAAENELEAQIWLDILKSHDVPAYVQRHRRPFRRQRHDQDSRPLQPATLGTNTGCPACQGAPGNGPKQRIAALVPAPELSKRKHLRLKAAD